MGDDRTGLDLEEDDSLPWLEPVDDYDEGPGVSPVRVAALVIGGLALIALVVAGVYWLQKNPRSGEGELIVAEEGDYKVPAEDTDARTFEGEGDASYAASEGAEPDGKIDASRASEAPAIGPAAGRTAPKTEPAPATKPAETSGAAAKPAPATGGVTVQLGAFGNRAGADTAWKSLKRRIGELSAHSPAISSATVAGGTVYRLRTNAKSKAAADRLCAAVRAKGENCIIIG